MSRWDILGIGVAAVDDLLFVDQFPRPDTKVQMRAEARQGGGLTATALVAAARLGARPAYLAVLGDDDLSRFTLEELEREGVDCSPVIRRRGARPVHSTIIVDARNGQRTILYTREGVVYPSAGDITEALIRDCRVLFADPYAGDAGLCAVNMARAAGIPVVADVESTATAAAQHLIARADHLIMGLEAGRQATGLHDPAEIAAALGGADRSCSAITAGGDGCWYVERDGPPLHVPALAVQVVDTTGCGDVFHGAYAAAIARNEPIATAIRVATVAAGLKATQPGGRAGIPDRAAVDRALTSL